MTVLGSSARLSDDGLYRYELLRRWDHGPVALWIMLNPSTADASLDDPTIRRVTGFCRRWGFGGARVVNLFALRTTHPDRLLRVGLSGVGPDNDATLERSIREASAVIAAWGAHSAAPPRARFVEVLADVLDRPLVCLGVTKDGAPRHPLYMPGTTTLQPWPPR